MNWQPRPLPAARDDRLIAYSIMGLGGLIAAVITGQSALAALSAPFVLALALGLRRTGPLSLRARAVLDADQVLEGDIVGGRVELDWDGMLELQVLVTPLGGVDAVDPEPALSWSLPATRGPVALPMQVQAKHWGRHTLGRVWVRAREPDGLVRWEGPVAHGPTLRVLPGSERLTRLLDPAESRAAAGTHRSRRIGDGSEFAELRPYTPGDRLRDLNWSATARHQRPFVNRHHPERSGEVVVVVDAFVDGSADSTEALARSARAAWAVASVHLQANDRVGLVGIGRTLTWLHPGGGRRARYALLEALLAIGGTASDDPDAYGVGPLWAVPPSALVVGLTPLHDRRIIGTLQSWRSRGRAVAAIVIDTSDRFAPAASTVEAHARRIWSLELQRRQRELADVGIPVITWSGDGAIGAVIAGLRQARDAPTVRMGR